MHMEKVFIYHDDFSSSIAVFRDRLEARKYLAWRVGVYRKGWGMCLVLGCKHVNEVSIYYNVRIEGQLENGWIRLTEEEIR